MTQEELREGIEKIVDDIYYFGAECGGYDYGTDAWTGNEYVEEIMKLILQLKEES